MTNSARASLSLARLRQRVRALPLGLLALGTLSLGMSSPAAACTNVYGIPGECQMSVHELDPNPNPTTRLMPRGLSHAQMVGRWTYRAFLLSPDEGTLVTHQEDGVTIHRGKTKTELTLDLRSHNPRGFVFSPNSLRCAFWAPNDRQTSRQLGHGKRIALARLEEGFGHTILYTPGAGWRPYALEWTPKGDALWVLETRAGGEGVVPASAIRRVGLGGGVKTMLKSAARIDFFTPSPHVSPNTAGTFLVGRAKGLTTHDAASGKVLLRLPGLPTEGLHNLDWNPKRNQIALFYRRARNRTGLYHVDFDALNKLRTAGTVRFRDYASQVSKSRDVHTLWYSPKGSHLTWASNKAAFLWRLKDPASKVQVIKISSDGSPGEFLEVKGVAWKPDQSQLAITAGSEAWIQTFGKTPRCYRVAKASAGFLARPTWRKGKLLVSRFEAAKIERSLRRRPPLPR